MKTPLGPGVDDMHLFIALELYYCESITEALYHKKCFNAYAFQYSKLNFISSLRRVEMKSNLKNI